MLRLRRSKAYKTAESEEILKALKHFMALWYNPVKGKSGLYGRAAGDGESII